LRAAGLAGALAAAGVAAWDAGDLPVSLFATTAAPSGARNLSAVLEVVSRVADAVAAARAGGDVAVLLGGDCTLVLGAVAGLRRQERASGEVGVFYLDGDADLDTPQEGWESWTVAALPTCSATATPSWPPCGRTGRC
jgi:arginase